VGRIAFVVSFETNTDGGENIDDVKVDVGGGEVLLASHFTPPGVDARPLAGDYVATTSYPGGSEEAAVAYADADNEGAAGEGEVRLYSRDSTGAVVAAVHCKADGSIRIDNDAGYIELQAGGMVDVNGNLEVDP
jgi:hypothetical protein